MLISIILGLPLGAALVAGLVPWRAWIGWMTMLANASVLACGVALCTLTVNHQALRAIGGGLRADALASFMVVVIGAISLIATSQTVRYLDGEIACHRSSVRHASLYVVLVQLFVACMLLAVLAANLGVMWVAIEATTIATTFLVGFRRSAGALEASWKYVIICSVGIALALLGTVLVYFAALHVVGSGSGSHNASALDWTSLMALSPHLDPGVMRLGMALLVFGYGTKIGLVPMYSWLPDAHSEAPAPVSALMSGVLLTVAFYALLRFKAIADGALGPGYMRSLLIGVGLVSLFVATSLLLTQRDFKRMLAYSSMEHMSLIALGAAAGSSLAIAAVLLHILGHGIVKAVLFLSAGEIYLSERSSAIAEVHALMSRRPALAGIFGLAIMALLGLPPFSLFVSELNMIRAEVAAGLAWVAAVSLVLMSVIFVSVAVHTRAMLLGDAAGPEIDGSPPRSLSIPLIAGLALSVFMGISAWPLAPLLRAAARVIVK